MPEPQSRTEFRVVGIRADGLPFVGKIPFRSPRLADAVAQVCVDRGSTDVRIQQREATFESGVRVRWTPWEDVQDG